MANLTHNHTTVFYTKFVLFGFPGVKCRNLLLIPFTFIFAAILTGNVLLIYLIFNEPSLQSPMYFLMSLLFTVSISSSTSVFPKLLLGLAFGMNEISLVGCLIQMFSIYFLGIVESGILMMMALDRFIAVCRPLRYNNIMTKRLLVQLILVAVARSLLLIVPTVTLTSRVHFCRSNIILNFVCENMGLLSLACEDISKVQIVGLMVKTFITVVDVGILFLSYSSILYTAMKIVTGRSRQKALSTCVTHVVVATFIYICGFLASLVYRIRTHISYDVKNVFNAIYLMVPATLNPIFYGVGVNEIRKCLVKHWKNRNKNLSS
ncbi:olfactory receptor 52K1-like [Hyperolius riggenbachi]|uniref:olfactory receptor 52K1-like n=1 Tax=Hyperolius riggenbachi TaxID=752182 RepID=UPI0035A2B444